MVVNLGIAGLNSLKIKTTERFITGPGAPHLSLRDFLCVHSDRSNSSAVRPSQVVISIQQTWSCPSVHVIPYVVQLHEHVWHCTGVCQLLCGKHMLELQTAGWKPLLGAAPAPADAGSGMQGTSGGRTSCTWGCLQFTLSLLRASLRSGLPRLPALACPRSRWAAAPHCLAY